MNRFLTFLFLSSCLLKGNAQSSNPQRIISHASLAEAYYMPASNIQEILFDQTKNGLLKLYRFDSFDKTPRAISFSELINEIFPPWKKKTQYSALQYDGYTVFKHASVV